MNHFTYTLALLLTLGLSACSARVDPKAPPEIVYGEDVCDRCNMIISDERFAASVVVETAPQEYEHLLFDDIGGMVAHVQEERANSSIISFFVHDYDSKEWLPAQSAFYVVGDLQTPMGFGMAAFKSEAQAETQAEVWQGQVLDFQSVLDRPMAPMQMDYGHAE